MKPIVGSLVILELIVMTAAEAQFKTEQLRYERVRVAYAEREETARKLFTERGLSWPPAYIFLRVFKKEMSLELWASESRTSAFTLVKTYPICAASGDLGPKRRQGDYQVPEGFYRVSGFNPASNFYLSLRVNYPNRSDTILGNRSALGGDIFIHGNCVTIGCIPIQDEIKELYLIAVEVKHRGREIPVHIFPSRLTDENLATLQKAYSDHGDLLPFWQNLKPGFDFFETNHKLPKVTVDDAGKYKFTTD